jgi:hypothetical protein
MPSFSAIVGRVFFFGFSYYIYCFDRAVLRVKLSDVQIMDFLESLQKD